MRTHGAAGQCGGGRGGGGGGGPTPPLVSKKGLKKWSYKKVSKPPPFWAALSPYVYMGGGGAAKQDTQHFCHSTAFNVIRSHYASAGMQHQFCRLDHMHKEFSCGPVWQKRTTEPATNYANSVQISSRTKCAVEAGTVTVSLQYGHEGTQDILPQTPSLVTIFLGLPLCHYGPLRVL